MGLFRRSQHRFQASPLSLAVPLEGTDTVVGLRELQRRKDGYDLARALKLDALDDAKPSRTWRKRYKGPFLHELTPGDLQKKPRDWRKVLFGQGWHTYNVPGSLAHLCERAEENMVFFLPNYLRLLLLLILISLVLRPLSLMGAASVAALVLLKLTAAAPPELKQLPLRKRFWLMLEQQYTTAQAALVPQQTRPHETQQARQQQPPASAAPDALQSVVQLVCYVLVIYCNTLGRVFRALLWCSWAVGAHACLRRSPAEYLEALKNPEISGGRVEPLSGHPSVPGIAFTEVVGLSGSGGRDPRRVFREAWQLSFDIGSAAAAYCWHGLQFYCHKLWIHARTSLPISLLYR